METTNAPTTIHRVTASALWTVAVTLLAFATFHDSMALFAWGVFASQVACVSTGWLIVEHRVVREQQRTAVQVAAAVARAVAEAQESSNVPRIR